VQYAFNASSPMPCGPSGHWSPREAEGKSDAYRHVWYTENNFNVYGLLLFLIIFNTIIQALINLTSIFYHMHYFMYAILLLRLMKWSPKY
jgi:amino acid transporter